MDGVWVFICVLLVLVTRITYKRRDEDERKKREKEKEQIAAEINGHAYENGVSIKQTSYGTMWIFLYLLCNMRE